MIVSALFRWPLPALGLAILACAPTTLRRTVAAPSQAATLDRKSPYLKAHLRTGYVYVLQAWQVDSSGRLVSGRGSLLTPNRAVVSEGEFQLPVDSVALFETNLLQSSRSITALSIMTGITAGVTAYCITNTKTCFGSCPTFYVADSAGPVLQAEGFSASIAPALEAVDVDHLFRAHVTGRDLQLRLTNEALETHVVRYADILAIPRPHSGRAFMSRDGQFRPALQVQRPARCLDAGGNCLDEVAVFDGRERMSLADSADLAARETIDLDFSGSFSGDLGLVITSRQSLMSTYLLYQTFAYLGSQAPVALAALGSGAQGPKDQVDGIGRILGRIEVMVRDSLGRWESMGSTGETGPLAADTKVIPLPSTVQQPIRVRLQLTRGLWRIDYLALARLGEPARPLRIPPARVERRGVSDTAAWRALVDTAASLVTLPGDEYDLIYRLPAQPEQYEFFLESRGYYLEWLRREWLAEENLAQAAMVLLDPAGALRVLAPAFKQHEPDIERLFWNSKYVRR